MTLTSRERVQAVINHEIPDRVPIILGVSNATGIKMRTYQGIKQILGLQAPDDYLYDWPELGTARIDEETMVRLHSDVRGVKDKHPASTLERNQSREPHSPFIDSWGSGQKEIEPGEWFPGIHPLSSANTIEDIENYPGWPDMSDPTRIAHVKETAKRLADENQYAILATPWLLFPLERAFAMQGMDNFLLNLAIYPDFTRALLQKTAELCKELMGLFLAELGDNVDMIKIGDDLGTQESLLMSPDMYRDILKPIHADYIRFIKDRTQAKVFFHTDGDVVPLIDDFIEMGVDILNPIQTSAGKMSDLKTLKKRFGKNIIFCGGIDTHRILPAGTPAEVRDEVKRVIRLLGEAGGFMVASVHTIMNDVPPENVLAMVDAVTEFGSYPFQA
jgi:uroporphyrinogen decarboxylase